jgi:DNA-binding transcriptional MerR regulator
MKLYSIAQASKETDLSPHTLRYYERSELIPRVAKDTAGRRVYTESDLKALKFIKALRGTQMPISEIREYGRLYFQGKRTLKKRKKLLEAHRTRILDEIDKQSTYLEVISAKIDVMFDN